MSERLNNGQAYRIFAVIDIATRESLRIDCNRSMPASRVVAILNVLAAIYGLPDGIVLDNGPEYTALTLKAWAARNGVELYYIDPGKPTQNAFIESFNNKFRNECVDIRDVDTMAEARQVVEAWRVDYNTQRGHSSLGDKTPAEYSETIESVPFRALVDARATRGDNISPWKS